MVNWLKRLFAPKTPQLIAMRLANMIVTHPEMDTSHACTRCRETVGLYPSGQAILKQYPRAEIVCDQCTNLTELKHAQPAPGALDEARDSRR